MKMIICGFTPTTIAFYPFDILKTLPIIHKLFVYVRRYNVYTSMIYLMSNRDDAH